MLPPARPVVNDNWLAKLLGKPLASKRATMSLEPPVETQQSSAPDVPDRLCPSKARHRGQRGSACGQMQECAAGSLNVASIQRGWS